MKSKKLIKPLPVIIFTFFFLFLCADRDCLAAGKYSYRLGTGETVQIKLTKEEKKSDYLWKSLNTNIVTVNSVGEITGISYGRTLVQRFSADGKTLLRTYKIAVKNAPSRLTLNVKKATVFKNCTFPLKASVKKGLSYHKPVFSSSNKKVAIVSQKGVIRGKSAGTAVITAKTYNGLTKTCRIKVKSPKKVIGLSFDDGPAGENTAKLLSALKQYDCHASFFMVGNMVPQNKQNLTKMLKDGHELGIHTWDHARLTELSAEEMTSQITKTAEAIKKSCGQKPTLLRPPYGAVDEQVQAVSRQLNYPVILWNIDTMDWQTDQADVVKNNILSEVHDGAILLLHDSHPSSVEGFIQALPILKSQGYELVTVSQLAAIKKVPLKPGDKFYGTNTKF